MIRLAERDGKAPDEHAAGPVTSPITADADQERRERASRLSSPIPPRVIPMWRSRMIGGNASDVIKVNDVIATPIT
jgi:hypothetical protein